MKVGMVDRGADLRKISQYPNEKEISFAPLTGIEVVSTRVEESVLVLDTRLSCNLMSLTIDEVSLKRYKVLRDMCANLKL